MEQLKEVRMSSPRVRKSVYFAPQILPEKEETTNIRDVGTRTSLQQSELLEHQKRAMIFETPAQSFVHNATGNEVSASQVMITKKPQIKKYGLILQNGDYVVSFKGTKERYAPRMFELMFTLNESNSENQESESLVPIPAPQII